MWQLAWRRNSTTQLSIGIHVCTRQWIVDISVLEPICRSLQSYSRPFSRFVATVVLIVLMPSIVSPRLRFSLPSSQDMGMDQNATKHDSEDDDSCPYGMDRNIIIKRHNEE